MDTFQKYISSYAFNPISSGCYNPKIQRGKRVLVIHHVKEHIIISLVIYPFLFSFLLKKEYEKHDQIFYSDHRSIKKTIHITTFQCKLNFMLYAEKSQFELKFFFFLMLNFNSMYNRIFTPL